MSQTSEMKWERVINFGKHTHIITEGKTLCGRDVSGSRTIIQSHPSKKCQRCNEYLIALKINPMYRKEKYSTSPYG